MHHVGIFGHKFENLKDQEKDIRKLQESIELLKYQYCSSIVLNLGGERGLELMAGDYCVNQNIKYHLFLPQKPEVFIDQTWYDHQNNMFNKQLLNATSITICSSSNIRDASIDSNRDNLLIQNSNFLIAFWNGRKIGRTYDMIWSSLSNNKIVLNGFDELKLLTSQDL